MNREQISKVLTNMYPYVRKIAKFCWKNIFYILLGLIICILLFRINKLSNNGQVGNGITAKTDSLTTTVISYDKDFKDLKKENRALYDSLKNYKDEIDYLLQFSYHKEYKVDTVFCDTTRISEAKTYTYTDSNDTLSYELQIGSRTEPNWYKINMAMNEQFTIVNKSVGDGNETNIQTVTKSDITDVTVYQPKNKSKFFDRFAVGPQVGVGYDVVNNKVGVSVGIGITYDLFHKRKK